MRSKFCNFFSKKGSVCKQEAVERKNELFIVLKILKIETTSLINSFIFLVNRVFFLFFIQIYRIPIEPLVEGTDSEKSDRFFYLLL